MSVIDIIPETPAQRVPVEFAYDCAFSVNRVDLEMIRAAADGFTAAVKSGLREGLCSAANGVLLCTRRVDSDGKHSGPHVCAEVRVIAHAIWIEAGEVRDEQQMAAS